jgi:hypothetical protein
MPLSDGAGGELGVELLDLGCVVVLEVIVSDCELADELVVLDLDAATLSP